MYQLLKNIDFKYSKTNNGKILLLEQGNIIAA